MQFTERLKELIDSPKELSEAIDITPSQIHRWKTGQAEMGVYKLKEICQFYNVSADWLLGLTDDDDDDDIVTIKLTREQAKIVKQSINDALK